MADEDPREQPEQNAQNAQNEQNERSSARQDLILASALTALGLVGILIARGGIGLMIAGSVGTIGASVAGVLLIAADSRLSYRAKIGVAIPFTFLMLVASLLIRDNPFAFVGYPLLALGITGLVPALRRSEAPQMAPLAPKAALAMANERDRTRSESRAESHATS